MNRAIGPRAREAIRIHIEEIPYEAVCLYGAFAAAVAFWRGGAERALVGAAVLAQVALSLRFELNPDVGLLIDAATLAICLTVALRGRGYWTLWAAASPVLSLATQMLRLWPGLTSWSYHSAQQAWFLALITALLLGALWPSRPAAMAATVDGHRP